MSKLFFEMTETEAQLQNILNSLEYAQYQMSTGINGYGNGTMTREEHQAERAEFVRGSYERYTEADRRVCITGRRWTVARNGSGRNHADQCRKRGSVRSNPESLPAWNGESEVRECCRTSGIWIRGHGRVETVRFDRSGRLHDKRPGDRRKGRSSLHDVPERRREVYYYQAHYNKLIFHL